jgi:hypothetical protein
MIDSEFIIKYTNALYGNSPENSPRYEEFRDMFSSGQIKSKTWLATELSKLGLSIDTFCICGAWFGTLAFYIKKAFPNALVTCLDVDPRCTSFITSLSYGSQDSGWLKARIEDMYKSPFDEKCIINTSCEHIPDIKNWLSLIPKDKYVVLQSTNYTKPEDHISVVHSIEEFEKSVSGFFKKIHFSGKLELNVYTRYMIIAET